MLSKSRTLYKIEAMAKGKPFDFNKALPYAVYLENGHDKAIEILNGLKKIGNQKYNYYLITEITTQVLVE